MSMCKIFPRFSRWFKKPKSQLLYEYAKSQLGKPKPGIPDTAPDMVNCVEALNQIGKECFGIPFCVGPSTIGLFGTLRENVRYLSVPLSEAQPGDIVVSPTQGKRHGHCGIMASAYQIMSNDSYTGLWSLNHDVLEWKDYYGKKLGLATYVFRLKD